MKNNLDQHSEAMYNFIVYQEKINTGKEENDMKYTFEGGRYAASPEPTVNINPKGIIYFNYAAITRLGPNPGTPLRLRPIYDDETGELILKRDNEGALRLDLINNGKAGKAYSKTFIEWLKEFDIDLKKYKATWDDKEQALIIKTERIVKEKATKAMGG